MSILSAQALYRERGGRTVLNGIDISLYGGELLALLGPNGAGKTTLLRLLAGLDQPDRGTVLWQQQALQQVPRRQRAKELAYLAQSPDCHWDLHVAEVVALGRLPHRNPFGGLAESDHRAIAEALQLADLSPFANRPIHTLSGGEQRRVFLARALAGEPRVLLADEPVSGLDPAHQWDVMQRLQGVARDGAAVVVVLHDLSLAARYCDRVVLLADGRIQGDGPPAVVLDDQRLAQVYGVRVVRIDVAGRPLPVVAGLSP